MPRKPNRASGYASEQVRHVRATYLYIATKLGDLTDETVIVGGAEFLRGQGDDELQADVRELVLEFVRRTRRPGRKGAATASLVVLHPPVTIGRFWS